MNNLSKICSLISDSPATRSRDPTLFSNLVARLIGTPVSSSCIQILGVPSPASTKNIYSLKLCRENGSRTNTYVPEIYSRQTYKRTYQVNFHAVLSKNFWRDVPFNLTFYPPNMKNERSRNRASDFRGKWIIEIRILTQDVADVAC
ncbi:hypothetical protein M9H77_13596 [Catharanthus roseus]|uniref:Uncharacterized protein n=1 Tax=Catharanthus roseus TaxID=4058 RepID=A0ACC0BKU9_CATRO|nr:hypothetical protein M9H77_13596 [Catharanthus roseus]